MVRIRASLPYFNLFAAGRNLVKIQLTSQGIRLSPVAHCGLQTGPEEQPDSLNVIAMAQHILDITL